MKISLKQHEKSPNASQVDALTHWVFLLPAGPDDNLWRRVPYGDVLCRRRRRLPDEHGDEQVLFAELPNENGTQVTAACMKPDIGSFALLAQARRLVERHIQNQAREVGICVFGHAPEAVERLAEAVIAALLAAAAEMPSFHTRRRRRPRLASVHVYGQRAAHRFRRTFAAAEGNNLARYLTRLPSNELTPGNYRKRVEHLAREHGWDLRFFDLHALARKKAGAFLAVAQGSPEPDAGILRLRYRPKGTARRRAVALVGKGICFDTGGTNLKPANFMLGMHADMQGSAVALGTLLALSRLRVSFPVDCWMALAANHIGEHAYKPNDVVTAANGMSIEVIDTDAEGRMVLADTLVLACAEKPALVLDFATLTGSCMRALGKSYSGVFTNRADLISALIEAGRASGERVWPFPNDEDYDEALNSDIADLRQCAPEGAPDHILAARFLGRFVGEDIPWVHVDLSSGTRKGGLAHIPTDITGFGIRFSLDLLLDRGVIG